MIDQSWIIVDFKIRALAPFAFSMAKKQNWSFYISLLAHYEIF